MRNVLDMNLDGPTGEFTSSEIMKHVKKNFEESTGFIDTLTFFRE